MSNISTPRPKVLTLQYAVSLCKDKEEFERRFGNRSFDRRGRAVAPWLPNKKGYRYERGQLVPRKRA